MTTDNTTTKRTNALKTIWLEFQGFGDVGNNQSFSTLLAQPQTNVIRVSIGSSFSSDDVGSTIYVEAGNFTKFQSGYYTLIAFNAIYLDLANNSVGTYTGTETALGAFLRLEDTYKLCATIPTYVVGDNAKARWFDSLISFSENIGQSISVFGGVSSVDGFSLTAEYINNIFGQRLTAYNLSNPKPLYLTSEITYSSTALSLDQITTGFSAGDVLWIDQEAMYVTATGSNSINVVRGVLNTTATSHDRFATVFNQLPTAMGQLCKVYRANVVSDFETETRNLIYDGVCDVTEITKDGNHIDIKLTSILISLFNNRGGVVETLRVSLDALEPFQRPTGSINIVFPYGLGVYQESKTDQFKWCAIGDFAFRLYEPEIEQIEEFDSYFRKTYIINDFKELTGDPGGVVTPNNFDTCFKFANDSGITDRDYSNIYSGELRRNPWIESHRRVVLGSTYTQTSYEIDARDAFAGLGTFEAAHLFESAEFETTFNNVNIYDLADSPQLIVNLGDALLQILTSTGTGNNTFSNGSNFDTMPREFGLGIPTELIDLDSFERLNGNSDFELTNLVLKSTQANDLSQFIKGLLEPYFLAIVQNNQGRLKLVDMSDYISTNTIDILSDSTLSTTQIGAIPKNTYKHNPSNIVDEISYDVISGQRTPSEALHQLRFRKGEFAGFQSLYRYIQNKPLKLIVTNRQNAMNPGGIAKRAETVLGLLGKPTSIIQLETRNTADLTIGDKVRVDISTFPDETGSRNPTNSMNVIGKIIDSSRSILSDDYLLTIICANPEIDSFARGFAAAGEIISVASNTEFTIATGSFSDTVADQIETISNDIDVFTVNDKIILFNQYMNIRSTSGEQSIQGISGSTITINGAFDNGSPITPVVGDIVAIGSKANQPTTTQDKFVYFDDVDSKWKP